LGSKLCAEAARLADAARRTRPREQGSPDTSVSADQADIIREAAWNDADEALGRALRDMGVLARSFEQLESTVDGEAAEQTRRAKGAANLVLQWVRQAARQRNIKALNSIGERIQFDPAYHELGDDASPGDYVRVVKPSIVRGSGSQQVVLIRGQVEMD
jgi:hypothetical protein